MNSGGGQEGRGLDRFDRFLGRPDRQRRLPPVGTWVIDTLNRRALGYRGGRPPAFGPPWGQESQISAPRESHPIRAELMSHDFRL